MASSGLKFKKTDDGYIVVGMGDCTDSDVVIPSECEGEPVVGIGEWAFKECAAITSVYIPGTVKSIGRGAFDWCRAMSEVFGMEGVLSIGNTFRYCERIVRIDIPEGVKEIGEDAFSECYRLIEVRNASSLDIKPGEKVYGYAGYYAVNVYRDDSEKGRFFRTEDGFEFYEHNGKYYLIGYMGKETELAFPDGVEGKSYAIFRCALYGHSEIKSIVIPSSVESIGARAFWGCRSLEKAYVEDLETWMRVAYENGAVNPLAYGCQDVSLIINGEPLENIVIPDGTKEIPRYAFGGLAIKTIKIPSSVKSIGVGAFDGCWSLKGVYIEDLSIWCKIKFAYRGGNPLEYADMLFVKGEKTYDLVIPEGVKSIGKYAFCCYKSLFRITLPESLTSINKDAFSDCYKLVEVCNHSNLTLTKGCEDNGCVARYAKHICPDDGITRLHTDKDGFVFYSRSGKTYLMGYTGISKNLTLPTLQGQKYKIYDHAFYSNYNISSISIPDGVTEIGEQAFCGSEHIKHVKIGDDVVRIGSEAFEGCSELESVEIGESVKEILGEIFTLCMSLVDVHLPNGLERIDMRVFRYCSSLKILVLPRDIERIINFFMLDYVDTSVYYLGDKYDWAFVRKDAYDETLTDVFFYSEDKPRSVGKFWHYDETGNPVRW